MFEVCTAVQDCQGHQRDSIRASRRLSSGSQRQVRGCHGRLETAMQIGSYISNSSGYSMHAEILDKMAQAIVSLDVAAAKTSSEEALRVGVTPYEALTNGLCKGLEVVGQKFEQGEYFLADMIMAAEAFKEASSILKHQIQAAGGRRGVAIVLGTVEGDIHDIGKSILATLLGANGFEVFDLGVDVRSEKFSEKALEVDAQIIGLSALLTTTMLKMKDVIGSLDDAGLRDRVKVIIGGRPTTADFCREVGADAHGETALRGVEMAKKLLDKK